MIALIALAALGAALLTFFTGFGLGTLLLPVFLLFFDPVVAVAATAVVHMANNLLKVAVVGRHADRVVLLRFVAPALLTAMLGAGLLVLVGGSPALHSYAWLGRTCAITPVKLAMGLVVLAFAVLELSPRFQKWNVDAKWLPFGGALSGFFGGFSGHQGAFRSTFLVRCGLSKESLVATSAVAAVVVDATRLTVYGLGAVSLPALEPVAGPVLAGCLAAFAGTFLGAKVLKKVSLDRIRLLVGVLLALTGVLLIAGIA